MGTEKHPKRKIPRREGKEQHGPQLGGPVGLGGLGGLPKQEWSAVLAWLPLRDELRTPYVHGCEEYTRLTLKPGEKSPTDLTLKIEAKDNTIPPEAREEAGRLSEAFGITPDTPRQGVKVFSSPPQTTVPFLVLSVIMRQDLTPAQMRLFAESANRIYGILHPK